MSDLTNVFTNIADAIRAKTETQITYKPTEMANAINNISSGGGGELVYNVNGVSITRWLNIPVTIAEGVTNTSNLFLGCSNFNQPVTIPNSVTNTVNMFQTCSKFNQPITIPNSVTNITAMFTGCSNFNQPVTIPNSVTSTVYMFFACSKFNQPITIPNSVTSISYMFNGCSNFNQPITIPNSVTSIAGTFQFCSNFNQPITIPNSVTDIAGIVSGCSSFNQPVIIPNNVTSTTSMFQSCYNFNQPVIIPNKVTSTASMFQSCTSFGSNIYLYTSVQKTSTRSMFRYGNNSLAKHIFTNNTNGFNGTASSNSVIGTAITWTQDGANYYNTEYNIYIHNVAHPYVTVPYITGNNSIQRSAPAWIIDHSTLEDAFSQVRHDSNISNKVIFLGENVTNMYRAFAGMEYFNQPVTIPSRVQFAEACIANCANFNSPVVIQNGVERIGCLLADSVNFDRDIWIPESITYLGDMLYDTAFESGTGIVHISHNIALGNTSNYIYGAFTVAGEKRTEAGLSAPLDPSRILNDY